MAFDWDKYKVKETKPGFDWDKYKVPEAVPKDDKYSVAGASILQGAHGATLNKLPQLYGALSAVANLGGPGADITKVGDYYEQGRKQANKELGKAMKDQPLASTVSNMVGGGLTAAAFPVLGAGLKGAALTGAIANYGSDPDADIYSNLKDAALGAAAGGAIHGALGAASHLTPTGLAKKGASWILNTPEELTEAYIANPGAIKTAPTRFELAKQFGQSLDELARETSGGSATSRKILEDEGKKISGERIQKTLGDIAEGLKQRSEGVWDNPQQEGAYNYLKDLADEYGKKIPPAPTVGNATTGVQLGKGYEAGIEKLSKGTFNAGQSAEQDNTRKTVAHILDTLADKLEAKSGGVWKNPKEAANYHYLKDVAGKYGQETPSIPQGGAAREFSTNRLKDLIQRLDEDVSYTPKNSGTGSIPLRNEASVKEARAAIDKILKTESPAYTEQMQKVAKDAELLTKAKEIGENPQRITNIFRRLNTDQYGSGQIPKETLKALDERLGTDYVNQARNATMKEAFDKSVTNGSKNVRLYSGMFKGTPLEPIAEVLGSAVDASGRKMTMSAIDAAIALRKAYNIAPGREAFEAVASPILQAAKTGNKEAALAVALFNKNKEE